MEIKIRRADINDASLVSKLSTVTFLDTFTGTCTDDDIQQFVNESFNEQQVFKELQDPCDFYFIAFINNEVVGYLRIKEEVSDVSIINQYRAIELKRIYVLKEYHNKKAGAALMKFALQFATHKISTRRFGLAFGSTMKERRPFTKKWGFEDTGHTHPFPIGNTPQTDHWYIKLIVD